MLDLAFQAALSGILTGGYYLLLGLGLSLIFGTMRIVNLAHGEVAVFAAYICYVAEQRFNLDPLLVLPLSVLGGGLLSLFIGLVVERIKVDRELNSLILTYGVSVTLANVFVIAFSATPHSTESVYFNDSIYFGESFFLTKGSLMFFTAAAIFAGALWFWLQKTWTGRGIRAVSSTPVLAALCSVNARIVERQSFFVAGCLGGAAGVAVYALQSINPESGHLLTIKAFVITVLAGAGSVSGIAVASILIGLSEALTTTLVSSSMRDLGTFVLFLIILILRPSGLFGAKVLRGSRQ